MSIKFLLHLSLGESNGYRLTAPLFGAFSPFRLDGRQPIFVSKSENPSKIAGCQVHGSFAGAFFRSGKAKTAGNTVVLPRALTRHGRKFARQNRQRFDSPKLKLARAASKLTQEQAAEALGVSRQTISNWETGKTYPDIVSVIKMSDIYHVSLDELLKGKDDSMTDYIEYLGESTDTVRCRTKLRKTVILATYLGVWTLCFLTFWLFAGPSDALGYSIAFLWIIMPVVTFVTALLIARNDIWGRRKWLSPLAFGAMLLLVEYGTFSLANMIANDFSSFNTPSLSWFLAGAVISLIGLAIGSIGKRH